MYSASSPLPLLLLSNVVGYIGKGFYLLLWAGLLRRPSHLRQYLGEKKISLQICSTKTPNIPEQHCPF